MEALRQKNRQPRRLLCFSAAFFLEAALFSLVFPQVGDVWNGIFVTGGGCFLLIFLALLAGEERARRWIALLLGLLAGWMWTAGYAALIWQPSQRWAGESGTFRVELTEPALGHGSYGEAWGLLTRVNGVDCRQKVKIYLTDGSPVGEPGDVLTLQGTLRAARRDSRAGLLSRGVFLTLRQEGDCTREVQTATTPLRTLRRLAGKLAGTVQTLLPGDEGTLLTSMLLGARGNVSPELERLLTVSGTRHITAVSGLHVSILSGALLALLGKRKGLIFALPAAVLYGAMVGFPPSVVRACVMLAFCTGAFWLRAESDGLTALGSALLLLTAACPFASLSAGLLLSFAASLGMILLAPGLNRAFSKPFLQIKPRFLRKLALSVAQTAGTSLAAVLTTFPLTLLFFDSVPLLGLVVNVLTLWAVSLSMVLGMGTVLLALIWPAGGAFLARWVLVWPLKWILLCIRGAGSIPFASTGSGNLALGAGGLAMLLLIALWQGKKLSGSRAAILCLALCLAIGAWTAGERLLLGEVRIENSGGAPVILLRGKGVTALNCGASPDGGYEALDEALRAWSAGSVDTLLCTGTGYKSLGGLSAMLSRAPVERILLPDGDDDPNEALAGKRVSLFQGSGTVTAGGGTFQLLAGEEGRYACRILCGELSLLDVSGLRLGEVEDALSQAEVRADILLLGDALAGETETLYRLCRLVKPRLLLVCGSGLRELDRDFFGIPLTQVGWDGVRIRFAR